MTDPLNYASAFAGLQSPTEAFTQGLQGGFDLNKVMVQQQQQQTALAQQQQQQDVVRALIANPSAGADEYANATLLVPGMREQLKQAWDTKNQEQKQSHLSNLSQWGAAIQSGKSEIAVDSMNALADAMENKAKGPTRESQVLRAQAEAVKEHPELGSFIIKSMLVAHPDGGKVVDAISKLGVEQRAADQAPADLRKKVADAGAAESDATTKAVTAKYADQGAALDLQKKGWDIKAIVEDIDYKKQSNRIAAMNAAANREGNALKREELRLKIDEAKTDRDTKLNEKTAKAESAAGAMDNMLNTIQRVLKNPALNDVVGSMEGAAWYPNQAVAMAGGLNPLTTGGDERADAIALIETLGSQAFLSQVPTVQGMGSLSNAEGEKLQSALQNLSRKQSESQFRATLNEASRLVLKSRQNISKRYGVPLGAPDTPAVRTSRPPLDSFFQP